MKKYLIKDLVGKHDLTVMEAASGKSALKKFYQSHMMNSGFYEFIRWFQASPNGSNGSASSDVTFGLVVKFPDIIFCKSGSVKFFL